VVTDLLFLIFMALKWPVRN